MSEQKKVIVSGVTGQDGSYMVDYLLANTPHLVYGMVRRTAKPDFSNLELSINNPRFQLVTGDLSDTTSIDNVVRQIKPDYFVNLAAQSFVKASWEIPEQTFDAGAMGVLRCLEAIRKHVPQCRFYNAGCHDVDTKILTKDGVKSYKEVKKGDLVYSINQETQELEFKPITRIFEYDYDGDLFSFKRGGLMVTPNHRMLYQTKRGNILVKQASEFVALSDVKYPNNKPLRGRVLEDTISLSVPDQKKKGNSKYGKHITSINSLDLCYLIGLYIGDGSCRVLERTYKAYGDMADRESKKNNRGQYMPKPVDKLPEVEAVYYCPQSIIDIPPSDEAFAKLTSVLDRNGIRWKLHGQCDVTFHQWGLIPFFEECGKSAHTKRIPSWIFDLDSKYQEKVLEGIMDSDGGKNGYISTCSDILQEDLLRLFVNCGKMPTFYSRGPRNSKLKTGRVITANFSEKCIHGLKDRTGYQRGNYEKKKYSGKVWCLEIADNHNFATVRAGKVTFSGNSSEEFGDVITAPQNEDHPLRPRSPYGAAKAAARHIVKVYRESYGIYAVQGLLFNHESERRGEEFVTRKITLGVAKIARAVRCGKPLAPIELGNLDARRDWSHAADFVDGIWKMLNQEKPREYVLASGETHTIREFVEKAFAVAGWKNLTWVTGQLPEDEYLKGVAYIDYQGARCSQTHALVTINPAFYRPAEVDLLLGDATRARSELGWVPKISFDQLVEMMTKHDLIAQ